MGPSKSGRSGNAKQESYTRGAWTEAEDEVLRKAVEENGPQKWRTLAERIPGRIGGWCVCVCVFSVGGGTRPDPWFLSCFPMRKCSLFGKVEGRG